MKFFLHINRTNQESKDNVSNLHADLQEFTDRSHIKVSGLILSFIDYDEEHVHKFSSASNITPQDYIGYEFDEIYGEEHIPIEHYNEVLRRKKGYKYFKLDEDVFWNKKQ